MLRRIQLPTLRAVAIGLPLNTFLRTIGATFGGDRTTSVLMMGLESGSLTVTEDKIEVLRVDASRPFI